MISDESKCSICQDPFRDRHPITCTPCKTCKAVFHNACLRSQAIVSGNSFKCPLCNDHEQFREYCKEVGIFIPDGDATWEDNRFYDDIDLPVCVSTNCRFQYGRSSNTTDIFLYCQFCGSRPIHVECNNGNEKYICLNCDADFKFEEDDEVRTKLASAIETNEKNEIIIKEFLKEKAKLVEENLKFNEENEKVKENLVLLRKENTNLIEENLKLKSSIEQKENDMQNTKETMQENEKLLTIINDLNKENKILKENLEKANTFCVCGDSSSEDDYIQCSNANV